ncbi:MAG: universal stress protein, partial [Acidimicrobiia bacterium]|nr:universal stress protein [Acidimicrobiia bacterium]
IVCPVDFSSSSLRALDYAVDLARHADGCVTILHALDYMDAEEPCEHVDAAVRQGRQHIIDHARERVHAVAAQQDATWCRIEEQVVIGRAYRAMLGYATTHRADLIVMGAQGRGGLDLMLYGSNTHHVVRGAACPVLTLRA